MHLGTPASVAHPMSLVTSGHGKLDAALKASLLCMAPLVLWLVRLGCHALVLLVILVLWLNDLTPRLLRMTYPLVRVFPRHISNPQFGLVFAWIQQEPSPDEAMVTALYV